MQKQEIFGLSAALVTPFRADGSVDLARLLHHAKYVLDQGCDSITMFGTTGEGFSIGMRERAAMLGAVRGAVSNPRKLNASVTATTTVDAVEQSRLAFDFGANGLLLAPPYYLKGPHEDGLFRWFSDVIEGIGADAHGVILYHIPGQTEVPLSIASYRPSQAGVSRCDRRREGLIRRQGNRGSISRRSWRTSNPGRRRTPACGSHAQGRARIDLRIGQYRAKTTSRMSSMAPLITR